MCTLYSTRYLLLSLYVVINLQEDQKHRRYSANLVMCLFSVGEMRERTKLKHTNEVLKLNAMENAVKNTVENVINIKRFGCVFGYFFAFSVVVLIFVFCLICVTIFESAANKPAC